MGLICVETATQTLQEIAEEFCKHVYQEYLENKYDIDLVEKEILIKDKGAFFEFLEDFVTSEEFTDHLFKIVQQTF